MIHDKRQRAKQRKKIAKLRRDRLRRQRNLQGSGLHLEALEDRVLLATLNPGPDPNNLVFNLPAGVADNIEIKASGGNFVIDNTLATGFMDTPFADPGAGGTVTVNLMDGDDTVLLNNLSGLNARLIVNGGTGSDEYDFGATWGGNVEVNESAGQGADNLDFSALALNAPIVIAPKAGGSVEITEGANKVTLPSGSVANFENADVTNVDLSGTASAVKDELVDGTNRLVDFMRQAADIGELAKELPVIGGTAEVTVAKAIGFIEAVEHIRNEVTEFFDSIPSPLTTESIRSGLNAAFTDTLENWGPAILSPGELNVADFAANDDFEFDITVDGTAAKVIVHISDGTDDPTPGVVGTTATVVLSANPNVEQFRAGVESGIAQLNDLAGKVGVSLRNDRLSFDVTDTTIESFSVGALQEALKLGFSAGSPFSLSNVQDILRDLGNLNASIGNNIDVLVGFSGGSARVEFDVDYSASRTTPNFAFDLGEEGQGLGISIDGDLAATANLDFGFQLGLDLSPGDADFNLDVQNLTAGIQANANLMADANIGFLGASVDAMASLDARVSVDTGNLQNVTKAELSSFSNNGNPLIELSDLTAANSDGTAAANFNLDLTFTANGGLASGTGQVTASGNPFDVTSIDLTADTSFTSNFDVFNNLSPAGVVSTANQISTWLDNIRDGELITSIDVPFLKSGLDGVLNLGEMISDALLFDEGADDEKDGADRLVTDLNRLLADNDLSDKLRAEGDGTRVRFVALTPAITSFSVNSPNLGFVNTASSTTNGLIAAQGNALLPTAVSGTAQTGGGADTIILAVNGLPTDKIAGQVITVGSGANEQKRVVTAYDSTTRIATVSSPWDDSNVVDGQAYSIVMNGVLVNDAALSFTIVESGNTTTSSLTVDNTVTNGNQAIGDDTPKLVNANNEVTFATAQELATRLSQILAGGAIKYFSQNGTSDGANSSNTRLHNTSANFVTDGVEVGDLIQVGTETVEVTNVVDGQNLDTQPLSTSWSGLDYEFQRKELTYEISIEDQSLLALDLPTDFELDLSPVGDISSDTRLVVNVDGNLQFVLGFDLSSTPLGSTTLSPTTTIGDSSADIEVDIKTLPAISVPNDPVVVFGRLDGDAMFTIHLTGATHDVTIMSDDTSTNSLPADIVTDINNAIPAAAGVNASLDADNVLVFTGGSNFEKITTSTNDPAFRELGIQESRDADDESGNNVVEAGKPLPKLVGQLNADAVFSIDLGVFPIPVTVARSATAANPSTDTRGNRNILDLVADVNAAVRTALTDASVDPNAIEVTSEGSHLLFTLHDAGLGPMKIMAGANSADLGISGTLNQSLADLVVELSDGSSHEVTLDGATTIGDVIGALQGGTLSGKLDVGFTVDDPATPTNEANRGLRLIDLTREHTTELSSLSIDTNPANGQSVIKGAFNAINTPDFTMAVDDGEAMIFLKDSAGFKAGYYQIQSISNTEIAVLGTAASQAAPVTGGSAIAYIVGDTHSTNAGTFKVDMINGSVAGIQLGILAVDSSTVDEDDKPDGRIDGAIISGATLLDRIVLQGSPNLSDLVSANVQLVGVTENDSGVDENKAKLDASFGFVGIGLEGTAGIGLSVSLGLNENPTAPAGDGRVTMRELFDGVTGGLDGILGDNGLMAAPDVSPLRVAAGTSQGATSNTVILESNEVGSDDAFNGKQILITGGRGAGQLRTIVDTERVSATNLTVTVDSAWDTNQEPNAASSYRIVEANFGGFSLTASIQAGSTDFGPLTTALLGGSTPTVGMDIVTIGDPFIESRFRQGSYARVNDTTFTVNGDFREKLFNADPNLELRFSNSLNLDGTSDGANSNATTLHDEDADFSNVKIGDLIHNVTEDVYVRVVGIVDTMTLTTEGVTNWSGDEYDTRYSFDMEVQAANFAGGMTTVTLAGDPKFTLPADLTHNVRVFLLPKVDFDGSSLTSLGLNDFADFTFQDIVTALRSLSDFLGQFEQFGFLDDNIPLIDKSVNDLLGFTEQFASAIDEAENNTAGTLQFLEDKINEVMGIDIDNFGSIYTILREPASTAPDDVLDLSYDQAEGVLRLDFSLGAQFNEGLDIMVPDIGLQLADLGLDQVDLAGSANLVAEGAVLLQLSVGIDIQDVVDHVKQGSAATGSFTDHLFLYDNTGLDAQLNVGGEDIAFRVGLGPFSLSIASTEDQASEVIIDVSAGASLNPALFTNGAASFNTIFNSGSLVTNTFVPKFSGTISGMLPVFFPNDSTSAGAIKIGGSTGGANPQFTEDGTLADFFNNGLVVSSDGMLDAGDANKVVIDVSDPVDAILNFDLDDLDLFSKIFLAIDGLDVVLGSLQGVLDEDISGFTFPLIGDELAKGANFIGDFREDFISPVRDGVEEARDLAVDFADPNKNIISTLIFDVLGPAGAGLLPGATTNSAVGDFIELDTNLNEYLFPAAGVAPIPIKDVYMDWDITIGSTLLSQDFGIGFDLGVPGLGLETEGDLMLDIEWQFDLGFGLSFADGFYLQLEEDKPELAFSIAVDASSTDVTGTLAFLELNAKTRAGGVTRLEAMFVVDIFERGATDAADAAKITFPELGSMRFAAGMAATAEADLDLTLGLSSDVVGSGASGFPSITGELEFDWGFGMIGEGADFDTRVTGSTFLSFGAAPTEVASTFTGTIGVDAITDGLQTVAINNVQLDMGEFLTDVIGPIVDQVKEFTEPLQPIIDFLVAPVPIIGEFLDVTWIDLAGSLGKVDTRLITQIAEVITLINDLDEIAGTSLMIPIGDMVIFDRANGLMPSLGDENNDPTTNSVAPPTGTIDDKLESTPTDAGSKKRKAKDKAKDLLKNSGTFSFPFLADPSQIFGLLQGKDATLVQFDIKPLELDFEFSQFFSIFGPLGISVGLGTSVKFDSALGFDTVGIRKFVESDFRNPTYILEGLFIDDSPQLNGVDDPELVFGASLFASAELNLGIARAGVEAELGFTIEFDLFDPDNDGKVRISELAGNFTNQLQAPGAEKLLAPLAIFDVQGEIFAILSAFLEIDFGLFSFEKEFPIFGPVTLLDFEIDFFRPPIFATPNDAETELLVHSGAFASQRLLGTATDVDEHLVISTDGAVDGDGNISVFISAATSSPLGSDSTTPLEYKVKKGGTIVIDGGVGNDTFDLSGFNSNDVLFNIDLGVGNDTLILPAGVSTDPMIASKFNIIRGGEGDDNITGSGNNDLIFGGPGVDTINAGAGNDLIFGDEGELTDTSARGTLSNSDSRDVINGQTGSDIIFGNGGGDAIDGGDAADLILGGGGAVFFATSTTEETDLKQLSDVKLLEDGALADTQDPADQATIDELDGGAGPDIIIGTTGADLINGGAGNDILIGFDAADTIRGDMGADLIFGDGGQLRKISSTRTTTSAGTGRLIDSGGQFVTNGVKVGDFIRNRAAGTLARVTKVVNESTLEATGDFPSGTSYSFFRAIASGDGVADNLDGGAGDDLIFGSGGGDVIQGGFDNDEIHGGSGPDVIFGDTGFVTRDNVTMRLVPTAKIENDGQSDGNDLLLGGGEGDTIFGGFGDDRINGGIGNDIVFAGAGDDSILGDKGSDFLDGQDGGDTYRLNFQGGWTRPDASVAPQPGKVESLVTVNDTGALGTVDLFVVSATVFDDTLLLRANNDGSNAFVALLNAPGFVERINYQGVERIVVNAGLGDDRVAIDDTAAEVTINGEDGEDEFQIGQLFRTDRTFEAANVAVDDEFATIETTRGFLSNGISQPMTINGGLMNDTFVVFHNKAVLTLNGDQGDDEFEVRAFALVGSQEPQRERTDITGGDGADLVQYAVNAPVNINGGEGTDTLIVVGTEFGDDFVVTEDGVFGAGLTINFVNIEKLQVNGAEGDDRFFVQSTKETFITEIFGGLGNDTFNMSGDTPPVVSNDLLGHSGIIAHGVESTDPAFDGQSIFGISANVADNEEPAVVIRESLGSTIITEGGVADSYQVFLTRQPTTDVFINALAPVPVPVERDKRMQSFRLYSNSPSSRTTKNGSALTLRFSPYNWFMPQTVFVVADNVQLTDADGLFTRPELNDSPTFTANDDAFEGLRNAVINHTVQAGADNIEGSAVSILSMDASTVTELDFHHSDTARDRIVRTGGSWVTDGFEAGMLIRVAGAQGNDGVYTLDAVSASTLTLIAEDELKEALDVETAMISTNAMTIPDPVTLTPDEILGRRIEVFQGTGAGQSSLVVAAVTNGTGDVDVRLEKPWNPEDLPEAIRFATSAVTKNNIFAPGPINFQLPANGDEVAGDISFKFNVRADVDNPNEYLTVKIENLPAFDIFRGAGSMTQSVEQIFTAAQYKTLAADGFINLTITPSSHPTDALSQVNDLHTDGGELTVEMKLPLPGSKYLVRIDDAFVGTMTSFNEDPALAPDPNFPASLGRRSTFTDSTASFPTTSSTEPGLRGATLQIVGGPGAGQQRLILRSTGNRLELNGPWSVDPVPGLSVYRIERYDGLAIPSVEVTIHDNDEPNLIVDETKAINSDDGNIATVDVVNDAGDVVKDVESITAVIEGGDGDHLGEQDVIYVRLSTQPTANVTVELANSQVLLSGLNGVPLTEGSTTPIATGNIVSAAGTKTTIPGSFEIDELAGRVISVAGVKRQIVGNVGGALTLDKPWPTNPAAGAAFQVRGTSLLFTSSNWNTPRPVLVQALDDQLREGFHTGLIEFTTSGPGATTVSNFTDDFQTFNDAIQFVGLSHQPLASSPVTVVHEGINVPVLPSTGAIPAGGYYQLVSNKIVFVDETGTPRSIEGKIEVTYSYQNAGFDGAFTKSILVRINDDDAPTVLVRETNGSTDVVEFDLNDVAPPYTYDQSVTVKDQAYVNAQPLNAPMEFEFDLTGISPIGANATLKVSASADLDLTSEFITISLDGQPFNVSAFATAGSIRSGNSLRSSAYQEFSIPISQIRSLLNLQDGSDQVIKFLATPSSQVNNFGANSLTLNLVMDIDPPTFFGVQTRDKVFDPNTLTFDFDVFARSPSSGGTLYFYVNADLDATNEFLTVDLEGIRTVDVFVNEGLQNQPALASISLTQQDLAQLTADDVVSIGVTPSADVGNLAPSFLSTYLIFDQTFNPRDSYEVVLTGEPDAPVTITLTPQDTKTSRTGGIREDGEQVAISSLDPRVTPLPGGNLQVTFDASNWDTPVEINVTAVDDNLVDGGDTKVFAPGPDTLSGILGPVFIEGGGGRSSLSIGNPLMLEGETNVKPSIGDVLAVDGAKVDVLTEDLNSILGLPPFERSAEIDDLVGKSIEVTSVKDGSLTHSAISQFAQIQSIQGSATLTRDLAITGATQANPVVLTITGHQLQSGSRILITDVDGMTELNDRSFEVSVVNANQVELVGVDGTGFGAFNRAAHPGSAVNSEVRPDLTITNATQSLEVELTFATPHSYGDGDRIFVTGVQGMTALNGRSFNVRPVPGQPTKLVLVDENSSTYAGYTGGGTAQSSTQLTINEPFDINTSDGELEEDIKGFAVTNESPNLFVDENTQIDVLFVHDGDSLGDTSGVLTADRISGLGMGPDLVISGELQPGGINYNDLEVVDIDLGKGNNTLTVLGTHTRVDDPSTTVDESFQTWTFINTGDEQSTPLATGVVTSVDAVSNNTTTIPGSYAPGELAGRLIRIVRDNGHASDGEVRRILRHEDNVLTLDAAWTNSPAGQAFEIVNGDRVQVMLDDVDSVTTDAGTILSVTNKDSSQNIFSTTTTIPGTFADGALAGQVIRIKNDGDGHPSNGLERRILDNVNNVLTLDEPWEDLPTGQAYEVVDLADGPVAFNLQDGNDVLDASMSTMPIIVFGGLGGDFITTGTADDIAFGDRGRVDYFNETGAIVTRLGHAPQPIIGEIRAPVDASSLTTLFDDGTKFSDDRTQSFADFPVPDSNAEDGTDDIGLVGLFVDINSGEGFLQTPRLITDNTADTLTLADGFDESLELPGTNPGNPSLYRISTVPEDQTDGIVRDPNLLITVDVALGGADYIDTGAGNDQVFGGAGGDQIIAGSATVERDVVIGDGGRVDYVTELEDTGIAVGGDTARFYGPTETVFEEDFSCCAFDAAKWSIAEATIDGLVPNTARFNGLPDGGDRLASVAMDLSGKSNVVFSYKFMRTGPAESPEFGEDLVLEYLNDEGQWKELKRHLGEGQDMTSFADVTVRLPGDALHSAFQFRFDSNGTAYPFFAFDNYFIDDVLISATDFDIGQAFVRTTEFGVGGADQIIAGNGDDIVFGGAAGDFIDTDLLGNPIPGDTGNDVILGDDGSAIFVIGPTGERELTEIRTDSLGQGGDDFIFASEGEDVVLGGGGGDFISAGLLDELDIVVGDGGIATFIGNTGILASVQSLSVNSGGSDIITVGGGPDVAFGGAGMDFINVDPVTMLPIGADSGDDVFLGDDGIATFLLSPSGGRVLSHIATDSTTIGDNDYINAGEGFDVVFGGDKDDVLDAGLGNFVDIVVGDNGEANFHLNTGWIANITANEDGMGGNDGIVTGAGNDIAFGGVGTDYINYVLNSNPLQPLGNDVGDDVFLGDSGTATFYTDNPFRVLQRIETTTGQGADDFILAGDGFDVVLAGDGNDRVNAGSDSSRDVVLGDNGYAEFISVNLPTPTAILTTIETTNPGPASSGDDIIDTGNGMDVAFGGSGNDTIRIGGTDGELDVALGDNGRGTFDLMQNPILLITTSPEIGGADEIRLGAGTDAALGGFGNDLIVGESGDDLLLGDNGSLSFVLNPAAPTGFDIGIVSFPEWGGDDNIFGNDGNDIIYDGSGSDEVDGGTGDDIFRIEPGFSQDGDGSHDKFADVDGQDQFDFTFSKGGITIDMDVLGYDPNGFVNTRTAPNPVVRTPIAQDAPQDLFDGNLLSIIRVGAVGQTTTGTSPIEDITGSMFNDTIFLDALKISGDIPNTGLSETRNVEGLPPTFGDPDVPPGDILYFDPLDSFFHFVNASIYVEDGNPDPFLGVNFHNIEGMRVEPFPTDILHFDFDNYSGVDQLSPTGDGYTTVDPDRAYPVAGEFGWQQSLVSEGFLFQGSFDRGSASDDEFNDVTRDGHFANQERVFTADLENGWYLISAYIGDAQYGRDNIQIRDVDADRIMVSGVETGIDEYGVASFITQVQDGSLDLEFDTTAGDQYWNVLSLEIRPAELISIGTPERDPLIADGLTVDTFTGYNAAPNALVTISPTVGVVVSPDASPDYQGVQVRADANGEFTYHIQRPTTRGISAVIMQEVNGDHTGQLLLEYISPEIIRLDLGGDNPAEPGYLGTDPTLAYNDAPSQWTRNPGQLAPIPGTYSGVGWNQPLTSEGFLTEGAFDRPGAAPGDQYETRRDGHFSENDKTYTTQLQPGDYWVNATVGDGRYARDLVSVTANGVKVVDNVTTMINEFYHNAELVTVDASGILTIDVSDGGGDRYWTLNGIEIYRAELITPVIFDQVSAVPVPADGSTVYTITGSAAVPDGTMLSLSTDLGEIASDDAHYYQGAQAVVNNGVFSFTYRAPTLDGIPTFVAESSDGSARGESMTVIEFEPLLARRFDFNGRSNSTEPGFIGVSTSDRFNTADGYGWETSPRHFERSTSSLSQTSGQLYRDGAWGTRGSSGERTFMVTVDPGSANNLQVYVGDRSFKRDRIQIETEDGKTVVVSTARNEFATAVIIGAVDANSDGVLEISFSDLGGDRYWVVNGLDISPGALPGAAPLTLQPVAEVAIAPEAPSESVFESSSLVGVSNVLKDTITSAVLTTETVTQAEIESTRDASIAYWQNQGITDDQVALLQTVPVVIQDLDSMSYLGLSHFGGVLIDDNAVGLGWNTDLYSAPSHGQVDLFTTLTHEFGHQLGLPDLYDSSNSVMSAFLAPGERRVDSLVQAVRHPARWQAFESLETVENAPLLDTMSLGLVGNGETDYDSDSMPAAPVLELSSSWSELTELAEDAVESLFNGDLDDDLGLDDFAGSIDADRDSNADETDMRRVDPVEAGIVSRRRRDDDMMQSIFAKLVTDEDDEE